MNEERVDRNGQDGARDEKKKGHQCQAFLFESLWNVFLNSQSAPRAQISLRIDFHLPSNWTCNDNFAIGFSPLKALSICYLFCWPTWHARCFNPSPELIWYGQKFSTCARIRQLIYSGCIYTLELLVCRLSRPSAIMSDSYAAPEKDKRDLDDVYSDQNDKGQTSGREDSVLSRKESLSAYFTIIAAAFGLISDGCRWLHYRVLFRSLIMRFSLQ